MPPATRMISVDARPGPLTIELTRSAVLVIDMQNDFGASSGMFDRAGYRHFTDPKSGRSNTQRHRDGARGGRADSLSEDGASGGHVRHGRARLLHTAAGISDCPSARLSSRPMGARAASSSMTPGTPRFCPSLPQCRAISWCESTASAVSSKRTWMDGYAFWACEPSSSPDARPACAWNRPSVMRCSVIMTAYCLRIAPVSPIRLAHPTPDTKRRYG